MKTKILANNIGAVKVLVLALACSVSVAKAAVTDGSVRRVTLPEWGRNDDGMWGP